MLLAIHALLGLALATALTPSPQTPREWVTAVIFRAILPLAPVAPLFLG